MPHNLSCFWRYASALAEPSLKSDGFWGTLLGIHAVVKTSQSCHQISKAKKMEWNWKVRKLHVAHGVAWWFRLASPKKCQASQSPFRLWPKRLTCPSSDRHYINLYRHVWTIVRPCYHLSTQDDLLKPTNAANAANADAVNAICLICQRFGSILGGSISAWASNRLRQVFWSTRII